MKKNIRKILLIPTMIASLGVISLEAVEITKNKSFTLQTQKKNFSTRFSIQAKKNNAEKIETLFKKVIDTTSQANICTGGQYTINPNYKYSNNERKKDGYKGYISFECNFFEIENYEALLDSLKNIDTLDLSQNQINLIMKDRTKELELLSFIYATEYIKDLSKNFTNCSVHTIDFATEQPYSQKPYALRTVQMHQRKTTVTAPIEKDLEQSLEVYYKFVCDAIR